MKFDHRINLSCTSFLSLVLGASMALAAPPEMNFDADSLSEVVSVGTDGATEDLQWSSVDSVGGYASSTSRGTLGIMGDNLISGNWLSATAARIGVVTLDANTDIASWKILDAMDLEQSVEFGTGDNLFISGADLNGNGLGDGVIVSLDGSVQVKTDLFDVGVADAALSFPARIVRRGKGIFASPAGSGDYVGFVIERSARDPNKNFMLYLKDLAGTTVRSFSAGPAPRGIFEGAIPVALPTGGDGILYVSKNARRTFLLLRDLNGTKLFGRRIAGTGDVIVGDFLADAGEEIGVGTDLGLIVVNPTTGAELTITGNGAILVDHINIHSFRPFGRSGDGGGGGGITTPPGPGLSAVCTAVREIQECEIWKSIASRHISDQRKNSTSWISERGCPGKFAGCIPVYDSAGTQIHSLGQYFPTGSEWDNRHYGCHDCGDCKRASTVASDARANTGSPEVYLRDNAGVCVRIPNANSCVNSSAC